MITKGLGKMRKRISSWVNEQEHIYFGLGLVCEVSHDVTKNIS
jgi:hypothetical protein